MRKQFASVWGSPLTEIACTTESPSSKTEKLEAMSHVESCYYCFT